MKCDTLMLPNGPRGRLMRHLRASILIPSCAGLVSCLPFNVARIAANTHPGCTYYTLAGQRTVALTIDDGPDPETTPAILDVLARNHARATFFVIAGRVPGNEALITRIVAEGHEIGNHFMEDRPSIDLPPEAFEQSLLQADSVLSAFGSIRWARPASGWYNPRMVAVMRKHGYRCALGSVYPLDAQIPWTGHMVRTIATGARPGAIIILHDGGSRGRRTAATLARVLPELTRRGYQVTTLSTLVFSDSLRQ